MKVLTSALLVASTLFSAATLPYNASAEEIIIQRGRDHDFGRPHGPRPDFDRPPPGRDSDKHHDRDLAIGILGGLAAGAIVGGAIVDQPRHRPPPRFEPDYDFYRPTPPRYPPPRPRPVPEYRGDADLVFQPWSRQWRDFCSNRYRTFNPNTGTYLGNDGKWYFCTVR